MPEISRAVETGCRPSVKSTIVLFYNPPQDVKQEDYSHYHTVYPSFINLDKTKV